MKRRALPLFLMLLLPAAAGADAYRTAAAKLAGGLPEDGKVCVLPFLYIGAGPGSRGGGVVSERLSTELIKQGRLKVLERALIAKVLGELKLQSGATPDEAQAKQAGRLLGAAYVVTGSLFKKTGGVLELNARAIEVATGEVKAAVKADIGEDWMEKFPETAGDGAGGEAFALCRSGIQALDGREFERAAEWFTKAIAVDEKGACGVGIPGLAYLGRSKAYKRKSGPLDAEDEEFLSAPAGYSMKDQGRIDGAGAENDRQLARYSALIKAMPDNAAAYFERGVLLANTKRYREARKDLDAAIRLGPGEPKYYGARGYALAALGLADNALRDFDAAIRLDPGYSDAYNARGNIYGGTGQCGKALPNFGRAIALAPGEALYYLNRARCLLLLKKYKAALKDCDKALELDPGFTEAYYRRGYVLIGLKQYDKAIKSFDKALELKPGNEQLLAARTEAADRKSGKFAKYDSDEKKGRELFNAVGN